MSGSSALENAAGHVGVKATRSVASLLQSPWTWVVIAALVRFGTLVSLSRTARELAPAYVARVQARSVPSSTIAVLQSRVQLRPLTEDEQCYDEMARNLAAGRGFVLDSRWLITTPGEPALYAGCTYPLFVAAVYRVFGSGRQLFVFVLQILLAAVAARWVFLSGRRVGGEVAGAVAAAFYALHPSLIWSSVAMMSESICVPLVAAFLYVLTGSRSHPWRRPLTLAALMAALCLARSTFGFFVWVVAGLLMAEAWAIERSWPRRLAPAAVFLLAFALICAPWTIRNFVHWHRFIPFSTKSGTNAWMHNHPGLQVEFGPRAIFGQQPIDIFDPRIQGLADEPTRDSVLMKMFLDFVATQPLKFLGLVWMRFWMAVLPVKITIESALASAAAWYGKGTVLAVALAAAPFVRRSLVSRMLPALLLAGYWILMQSLAGPGLRYRLPSEPAWALIIGGLAAAIWSKVVRPAGSAATEMER